MHYDGVIILPEREGFGKSQFGAVSLTVRDYVLASKFRVLTLSGVVQEAFENTAYRCMRLRRHWYESRTRAYARALRGEIAAEAPRFIEVHNRPRLFFYLRPHIAVPVLVWLHNDPQTMRELKTAKARSRLLAQAEAVVCLSHWIRSRLLEGVPEALHARAHVVPPGIAIPEALPAKEALIAFAGRLTPEKGADIFARAMVTVLPQLPKWRAILMGGRRHSVTITPSEYERQIAELVAPLGERIGLPGFTPYEKTMEQFARATIVVVPSRWQEPFGRTALEAMAAGAVVVTSGTGGLAEVVGDAGLLYPPEDVAALAGHLRALAQSPERLAALQEASRGRARHYSMASSIAALDAVRTSLL